MTTATLLTTAGAAAAAFEWDPVTPLTTAAVETPRANTVAVNAGGDAVTAWADLACQCVKARRRAEGGPWGATVDLGRYRDGSEVGRRIAAAINADGDVVVAWENTDGAPGHQLTVRTARLSWDSATPLTRDMTEPVDRVRVRNLGGVTLDDDGNALVVWNRHSDTPQTTVWAAELAAGASAWTTPELVASGCLHSVRLHANAEGTALVAYKANPDGGDPGGIEASMRVGHGDGWPASERVVTYADHPGPDGQADTAQNFNDGTPVRPHVDESGGATILHRIQLGTPEQPHAVGEVRSAPGGAWTASSILAPTSTNMIPLADAAFAADGAALVAWQDQGDGESRTVRTIARTATDTWGAPQTVTTSAPTAIRQLEAVLDDGGQGHVLLGMIPLAEPGQPVAPQLVAYTRPGGGAWSSGAAISSTLDPGHSWEADAGPFAAADLAGRVIGVYGARSPGDSDYHLASFTGDVAGGLPPGADGDGGGNGFDPGSNGQDPGNNGGDQPGAPHTQEPIPGPPAGTPFTITNTETLKAMPKVTGMRVDRARDAVERAGIRADFDLVESHRKVKGASIGDVVTQLPRAKVQLRSSVALQPRVKLTVYAGPKPQPAKKKANCPIGALGRDLKQMDLDVAEDVLGKQRVKTEYDITISKSAREPEVTKLTRDGRCAAEADVRVPAKPEHNDLFIAVREHPTGMSFAADEWTLTAGGRNAYTLQVVDRAGRLVRGAEVVADSSGAGSPTGNQTKRTDAAGEASFVTNLPEAGMINVLVRAGGRNDIELWGSAQLRVVKRSSKVTCFETVTGRAYRRIKGDWAAEASRQPCATQGKTGKRSAAGGNLLDWFFEQLFGRPATPQEPARARQTLRSIAVEQRAFPAQFAFGEPVGTPLRKADIGSGSVNVISAGSGNVISAGSGNVISAGSGNAVVAASAGVISAGGGNVISAGSGNVISAGSGNVVSAGSGNVISAGSGNVVSAGALNAIAVNYAGLLSDKGAGLIGGAGGNVVSAGALN